MAPEETAQQEQEQEHIDYPFYTEGTQQLEEARRFIAKFSIPRAKQRLHMQQKQRATAGKKRYCNSIDNNYDDDNKVSNNDDTNINAAASNSVDWSLRLVGMEISTDKSQKLQGCSFSKDGELVGTCSLSGGAKIWKVMMPQGQLTPVSVLTGHSIHATDIAFSPVSPGPGGTHIVATASADTTARLWNSEGAPLTTFKGHSQRLARIAFHPSGKYLGTASYDKTWRLWDVDNGVELLAQEGHSREVYDISFHPDGSLAASSGMDNVVRIWDLRTGKNILDLVGHVQPVLGLDFSPNGL